MLMPLCSLFYCRWCYLAAQHLTASAGGGGKGIHLAQGKKIKLINFISTRLKIEVPRPDHYDYNYDNWKAEAV